MMIDLILYIIASYLLGAIPFSLLVGYAFTGQDVRKQGSGNAGATNVYRLAGPVAAALAMILDVAKGVAPVLVARHFWPDTEWLQIASGFAGVLGHILPIFAGFRGGKGVNTLLGMYLALLPLEMGICLLVFVLALIVTRYVSVGSMAAGVSLSLIVLTEKLILGKNVSPLIVSSCLVVTLLVLFTHRANMRRLIRGEETRFRR